MIPKILAAIAALGVMLAADARAQTLILEPSATELGPGDTFTLKVSLNTGSLPIAGFSVYFNMAGTDASGSFIVQSETLSPDWIFLGGGPTLPEAIPDTGFSQDYGYTATPTLEDLPASTDLWLFTLQLQLGLALAPGNYTIRTTTDSGFYYDLQSEGVQVYLPSSAIAVTVVPEPSTLLLALTSAGIIVFLRRKLGPDAKFGRKC